MEIVRTNKYRLYPSAEQKALLHESFGCKRFIYNQVLNDIIEYNFGEYEVKTGKNKGQIRPSIPALTVLVNQVKIQKQKHPFLGETLGNDILQATLANLHKGFKGFITRVDVGYPKFKSRKHSRQTINMTATPRININEATVTLPVPQKTKYNKELYKIKFKMHKTNHNLGNIRSYTIIKENGLYFIAVTHKLDIQQPQQSTKEKVGLDLGIKAHVIDSNGIIVPTVNTQKEQTQVKTQQRKLSKKKKGSSNYKKQRNKLNKSHLKLKNKRNHRNNCISKFYSEYMFVSMETLKVKQMQENNYSSLNHKIADASWFSLTNQIKYKVHEKQGTFVQIDQFYPSTKTCSRCGSIQDMPLSKRTYSCSCGLELDRDINAAINILNEGLRQHNTTQHKK